MLYIGYPIIAALGVLMGIKLCMAAAWLICAGQAFFFLFTWVRLERAIHWASGVKGDIHGPFVSAMSTSAMVVIAISSDSSAADVLALVHAVTVIWARHLWSISRTPLR